MARRTPETLVDWLVVGIAPFLVMLLVGSLVFYLVEVFYLGDYQLRLLWVLGLFVMAIVCIARISMEEGAGYATLYAVPLAVAVGMALATFVEVRGPLAALGPGLNWILMAVVWWSAHKLTWDCTLMEGGRDFTGQGLMQTTGLDRFFRVKLLQQAEQEPAEPAPEETTAPPPEPVDANQATPPEKRLPVWQWWLRRDQRPHAPGVWVVYFSIAALPLFGIGQWFMPAGDEALPLRRRAFWLLVVYVASALALLMATSFLSLRRYLRQRKLEMPAEMAAVWLGTGAVLIVILLLVAALLPRPFPEYSIAHLAPDIQAPQREASRWGWGREGAKSKPGIQPTATQGEPAQDQELGGSQGSSKSSSPDAAHSGEQSTDDANSSNSPQNQGGSVGRGGSGENPSGPNQPAASPAVPEQDSSAAGDSQQGSATQQSQEGGASEASNESSSSSDSQNGTPGTSSRADEGTPPLPDESRLSMPSAGREAWPAANQIISFFVRGLRWFYFLVFAFVFAWLAWRHREFLRAAWQQLLRELRDLWERWFGRDVAPAAMQAPTPAPPPKRFADYPDPFATGLAARWSLAELVSYTFAALEARGRERNCPRSEEQTPLEYAAAIGQVEPVLASEFRSLADLYSQLAFAGGQTPPHAKSFLQQLWKRW
jgi:hypothetical protein